MRLQEEAMGDFRREQAFAKTRRQENHATERDAEHSSDQNLPSVLRRSAVRLKKVGFADDADVLWQLGTVLANGTYGLIESTPPEETTTT